MTEGSGNSGNTRFTVTLGESDLVEAFRLNARRAAIRPLVLAAVLVTALLVLLLAISPLARQSLTSRPLTLMLEGALALAALLLLLAVLVRPLIFRKLAQRSLAQRADLAGPVEWEFGAEGIRHTTIHSDSRYPWAALRGWRENEAVLLLYIADNLFYIVPKAQVGTDVVDGLHRAIAEASLRER
ncbi:YcxB family protein [Novosphingobium sp. G106]|uniref:YcxB family protein n=1 Tax=Novosphingobium sp. G106 TaxID=2849500 RepID=UPI001C2CFE1C|nr:YcxB family protein [Novosphingobium sp. G106]MBV1687117.1 YcxB family protein [Novosphingobium sp. G106]